MDERKVIWYAEFSYSSPSLTKVYVKRETDKSYLVDDTKEVMGWSYIGQRISKDSKNVFMNPQDAILYLIDCGEKWIEKKSEEINAVRSKIAIMRETIEAQA